MSWAEKLKNEIQCYIKSVEECNTYDNGFEKTTEILNRACRSAYDVAKREVADFVKDHKLRAAVNDINNQLQSIEKQINSLLAGYESIIKNREAKQFEKRHILARIGIIKKEKKKKKLLFWKQKEYDKQLADYNATLADIEEYLTSTDFYADENWQTQSPELIRLLEKKQELINKKLELEQNTGEAEPSEIETEQMLNLSEATLEELKTLYQKVKNRNLAMYLTPDEKSFIEKFILLGAKASWAYLHDNYPELTLLLGLLIGGIWKPHDNARHFVETETSVWEDFNGSLLCKEKCIEILGSSGRYMKDSMSDTIFIPYSFHLLAKNKIHIFTYDENIVLFPYKDLKADGEESDEDESYWDLKMSGGVSPDYYFSISKNLIDEYKTYKKSEIVISQFPIDFLKLILSELDGNDLIDLPSLVLKIRKIREQDKMVKINEAGTKAINDLNRLWHLTPEQIYIEEQRYFKQKEIDTLKENARRARKQREEHARLEREEIEFQAELDRRQREREAEREAEREERYRKRQLEIQRENARAEQRRWEEDKRREDEQRQRNEAEERRRQQREEQKERERARVEAKKSNDMRFICWKCYLYGNGCRGGIVGCQKFIPKK